MGVKKVQPLDLSKKCPECGREFIDYSEYRVEEKLRQHLRDKHGQKVVSEKH